ncbi:cupin domain-containing protein [Brevibacillus laterosporus]|uniref:oxalate decarboxylase family bicupin n=1 Tax=Brevibacillus TaxID=55080 RepID=UPI00024045CB|nr:MULTISPECIES: oxalate decarboxylase family bicupin [Brevibacillus]MBA4533115.1 oxalate decarboxylase family bicupin [Brevibacillus halotolerans]MCR8963356.1 oxalate decarboxylase family bicupin [Brevibacillus laterosporus]MCZ0835512.1 oxalate decarboxylase family bicupin [Brevibacillus halotolerans]MDF9412532.1 cupin domain-containing protein [Brevibacillus laterosporus]PCN43680.1 oxalate decarboxylase [Brevibacillus laterosporus]
MVNRHLDADQGSCEGIPQPIRKDGAGATDPGPRDIMRDIENPDLLVPPITDAGLIPNLKFSFSDTHMQLNHGGWSREVTVRELPIATTLAGVNMRLTPGGVRELHWHQQAEWSYMIVGRARITSVDQDGRNFIADVGPGDLWYFPPGIPHSIQGLEEGCEFLLVFDDGSFSDLNTLSITDWFAHTPKDVLSANFGVPEDAFANIPSDQVYIYQDKVPGPLDSQKVRSPYGTVPKSFTYRLLAQKPIRTPGGSVRIVDSSNFPASKTVAAALVEIKPGAMRELHWHPNNDEWQYYLSGEGRMTVFAGDGAARTFDYRAGDVGYVPFAYGHYVQNTGDQTLWFLEMFKSDRFADMSLNQWMALTPRDLVKDNLQADSELLNVLRKEKWPVVSYPGFTYNPK